VAATVAIAMVAMFATVTARFARRLAAGLAVTRATLVAVEITAASAAAAAAVKLALAAVFPFAAGVSLGLWCLGG
jgi:type IV pilus biogenesis protein CpaD/CtpE